MKQLAWVVALLTLPIAQPAMADGWTRFDVSNAWDGKVGTAAKVSGVIYDRHGTRSAELVVMCTEDTTRVFISADYLVFGGDVARAEYTIDGGPLQRAYWNVCAGDLCAGLWGKPGIQFVKLFLDAAVLKMTLTRYFGEPIQATFSVLGARGALREVGQRCHWMSP